MQTVQTYKYLKGVLERVFLKNTGLTYIDAEMYIVFLPKFWDMWDRNFLSTNNLLCFFFYIKKRWHGGIYSF